MMERLLRFAGLLVAALSASFVLTTISVQGADKDLRVFSADGPWKLEYANDACRLVRRLTDGGDSVTLAFERFEIGPAMRLGVATSDLDTWAGADEAVYRYLPNGEERRSYFLRSQLADGTPLYLIRSASLLDTERASEITEDWQGKAGLEAFNSAEIEIGAQTDAILIAHGFKDAIELRFGEIGDAIVAMQDCTDDLVRSWGVDPEAVASVSRPPSPIGSRQRWLNSRDYPTELLGNGQGGVLTLRLIVNPEGRVESCAFELEIAGPFERAACDGIKERARFEPALDAEGKPMRTYWRQTVVFSR